jgi:hypothetical protein
MGHLMNVSIEIVWVFPAESNLPWNRGEQGFGDLEEDRPQLRYYSRIYVTLFIKPLQ